MLQRKKRAVDMPNKALFARMVDMKPINFVDTLAQHSSVHMMAVVGNMQLAIQHMTVAVAHKQLLHFLPIYRNICNLPT